MDTKSCVICNTEFSKPYYTSRADWAERQFCSRACFGKSRRKGPETKTCVKCGAEFTRKSASNKDWANRKYCSTDCAYSDRIGQRRGPDHWAWKGGRRVAAGGYIEVALPDEHPYASMRRNERYVFEHRLVMAEHFGRPLTASETVHHVNGDRQDNRVENLQVRTGRHGKGQAFRCRVCGSHDVERVPL